MNLSDTLSIRLAIEELNSEFAWALDNGEYHRLDALFTEDVHYVSGKRTLEGSTAIRDFFENRAQLGPRSTRHMWTNLRITGNIDSTVQTTSVWLTFAANAPLPLESVPVFQVADFFDTFVLTGKGWRISERRIVSTFRNPDAAPPIP
jgi:3-phenylpropionate/cinnamic acid dioxygenase small subunit